MEHSILQIPRHSLTQGICWHDLKLDMLSHSWTQFEVIGKTNKSDLWCRKYSKRTWESFERKEFLFPIIIDNYQSFEDTLKQSQVEYNQEDDATFEISQDNNYYCSSNDGHDCSSNNASIGEDDSESFTRFEDDD